MCLEERTSATMPRRFVAAKCFLAWHSVLHRRRRTIRAVVDDFGVLISSTSRSMIFEKNILINCNSLTVIYFASSYTIFPSERKVYFNIHLVNEWSLVTKRDGMQTLGYLFLRIQSVDPLMLLREEESCEACSKGIRNKYFSPVEEISNLSPKHDLSFLSYSRTLFCQWHFERESYSMRATVRGTQFYWTFDRQSTLWECQGNKGTLAPRDSW